jgi:hypothetical protein
MSAANGTDVNIEMVGRIISTIKNVLLINNMFIKEYYAFYKLDDVVLLPVRTSPKIY